MNANQTPSAPVAPRNQSFWLWAGFATVAGMLCVVLPPHLIPGALIQYPYPQTPLPWFAFGVGNICFKASWIASAGLGLGLGWLQPRHAIRLALYSGALLFLLHAVTIVVDIHHIPDAHNLLPFEFVILGIALGPIFPGAAIGMTLRRKLGGPLV